MSNEDIYFIKKFNRWADIVTFLGGLLFISLLTFLISVSIPGILYDQWNNIHYINFCKIEVIILMIELGTLAIFTFCTIGTVRKALGKLNHLTSQNNNIQQSFENQAQASTTISLNQTVANTVEKGNYNIGNAAIDVTSTISIILNIRKIAKELVSYLPESERPKPVNFKIIFTIMAILSIIPIILGIIVSLEDKNENIENREDVVEKIKSVYYDYNPQIENTYNSKYYDNIVTINLNNDTAIKVRMDKYGQGKITDITFISKELLLSNQKTDILLDTLLMKVEMLYQRTEQYKDYYKEIFRDRIPVYNMDEEHRLDLIQKLDNIISKKDNTIEHQQQYQQYRDTQDKTAVQQYISLRYEENYVILELNIKEHRMQ